MRLYSIAALTMIASAALLSGCRTTMQTSNTATIDTDPVTGDREVNWSCAGEFYAAGQGKIKQAEYCEWREKPVQGATECSFNATFDSGRTQYLTQRMDDDIWFHYTQINSYRALIQVVETCVIPNAVCDGHCNADRASDPQVCEALQQTVRRGKIPALKDYRSIVPLQGQEDPSQGGFRFQLTVESSIAAYCEQSVDPSLGTAGRADGTLIRCSIPTGTEVPGKKLKQVCDRVAQHIMVRARFTEKPASASVD